jgi:hypothetical protein
MSVITNPQHIERLSVVALKGALGAQARGMSLSRGRSALSIARDRGLTTKRTVAGALVDVQAWLDANPPE